MSEKYSAPSEALGDITDMLIAHNTVMRNRTLINRLFNGDPPKTEEERRAENLKTNANWLEATRIASNATNQINNAFFKSSRYFSVNLDIGPVHKRATWSTSITNHINRSLKRSRAYKCAKESAHAQVVLHGPGPLIWKNRRTPIPSEAGIEDVVLPAGTLTSMVNLDRFAVYREWTWNQLYEMTHGKAVDPGWNMSYVKALLATLYRQGVQPIYQGNRWMFPEKIAEDVKEGSAESASSALPKVTVWDFFYRKNDNDSWTRKTMLDYNSLIADDSLSDRDAVVKQQEYLYEKDSYADEWSEICHWYIGNCSNVAPYRYGSTRSIGYLLYGVCMVQNQLRNRLYDHLFQQLLTLFKNVSEDHRERLGMIDLQNFGILPEGLSLVPANERHEVDWNLVSMGLNQGRQLMAESAQSFIPNDGMGTQQREMTATETLVRQNTSISLTSAVLNQLADQSVQEYREVCRRFCIKGNPDPMAVQFRECLRKDEVPEEMLDCEYWDVIPEMTVGGGNKAVELTVTQALMQEIFPMADPNGQRIIARRRYLALTDNPEEAAEVIPDAPAQPSDDVQYAQNAFAVLMLGMPFLTKEGVNHVAYAGMLLHLMRIKTQQTGGILGQPTGFSIAAEAIAGLMNVAQHIQEQIQIIGQDERKRDLAKQLFKVLQETVKALEEMAKQVTEMAQQQQPQGGIDPETQAKIQAMLIQAQTKSQIDDRKAQRKEETKQIGWLEENARRNATTEAEVQRGNAKAAAEIRSKLALTQADLIAKDLETAASIRRGDFEKEASE